MGRDDAFLTIARKTAPRRSVEDRIRDYREFQLPLPTEVI